jgi:hypothetical protein
MRCSILHMTLYVFSTYCGLGLLLIYLFNKVYSGGIDCGWSGDTQLLLL